MRESDVPQIASSRGLYANQVEPGLYVVQTTYTPGSDYFDYRPIVWDKRDRHSRPTQDSQDLAPQVRLGNLD